MSETGSRHTSLELIFWLLVLVVMLYAVCIVAAPEGVPLYVLR